MKAIPGKNLALLAGKSLLAYTAEAARGARKLDRVLLSTDDEKIAAAGRALGLDVPFLRPAELAADNTPMLPVIQHAVEALAADGWTTDVVVLLQPTSPLRRPSHVRDAVTKLQETKADSVVTVIELPRHLSPDYVMRIENGVLRPFLAEGARVMRRQDARPAYSRDGTVYACWRATLEKWGNIYGEQCQPLILNAADSLSIDSPEDWAEAERRLAER